MDADEKLDDMKRKASANEDDVKAKSRARRNVRLTVRMLPGEAFENQVPLALIEGDKAALEFIGNLILEHARNPKDCGIQMFPNGPGNIYFSSASEIGLYLHRLPCWNKKVTKKDVAIKTELPPGKA